MRSEQLWQQEEWNCKKVVEAWSQQVHGAFVALLVPCSLLLMNCTQHEACALGERLGLPG